MNWINGIKVEATEHDLLNFIQGTVVLPSIQDEEIPDNSIFLENKTWGYS